MTVALFLDSDIGTDVDDAYALAFAARHPGIDLRAVTTVSGDVVRRARIAAKLLQLAGRDDVEVAAGLAVPAGAGRGRAWLGHEGEGLLEAQEEPEISDRNGLTVLVDGTASLASHQPVAVATIGMQTNLAAALDRDPGLARRIHRVAVMGGVFGARADGTSFPPENDHNLNVDQASAVRALNADLPLLFMPCNITVDAVVTGGHLDRLRRGDRLCRALAALTERWAKVLRTSGGSVAGNQVATLHDPLTVSTLVEPDFVRIEELPVTVAVRDGVVHTLVDSEGGKPADVVTAADAQGFVDYCLNVVLGEA